SADLFQVVVDTFAKGHIVQKLIVRLPKIERADVADGHQRVGPRRRGVGEDPRIQVEVVVGLRFVDVPGAAARDRLELDQLVADLRRERLGRGGELFGGEARETPLVVGDLLHVTGCSSGRYGLANERGSSYGCVGPPSI